MRRAGLCAPEASHKPPRDVTAFIDDCLFTTRGVGSVALATSSIWPRRCGVWPMSLSRSSTYSLKFSTRNAMPVRSTSLSVGRRRYFSLNALDHSSRSARSLLYRANSFVNLATVTALGAPVAPIISARRFVSFASCSFMRRFVARSSSSSSSSTLASKERYTSLSVPSVPDGAFVAFVIRPGEGAFAPSAEARASAAAAPPEASERSAANAAARSAASVAIELGESDSEEETRSVSSRASSPSPSPSPSFAVRSASRVVGALPAFAASVSQGDFGADDRGDSTPSRAAASAAAAPPSSAAFFAAAMASSRLFASARATSAVCFAVASARAAAHRSR